MKKSFENSAGYRHFFFSHRFVFCLVNISLCHTISTLNHLEKKPSETIVGKGTPFFLSHNAYCTSLTEIYLSSLIYPSSENAFSLDWSKILLFGREVNFLPLGKGLLKDDHVVKFLCPPYRKIAGILFCWCPSVCPSACLSAQT